MVVGRLGGEGFTVAILVSYPFFGGFLRFIDPT